MERVLVGIHVHAEPAELQATLAAVRANTPPVELLLLPDGPDAPTREALAALRDLPQVGTDEPRGAPACFNRLTSTCCSRADRVPRRIGFRACWACWARMSDTA